MTPPRAGRPLVVYLRRDSLRVVKTPVVGRGGWQSLLRRVQRGRVGVWLTIERRDYAALLKWCGGYRVGGFQRRCRLIVRDIAIQQVFKAPKPPKRVRR